MFRLSETELAAVARTPARLGSLPDTHGTANLFAALDAEAARAEAQAAQARHESATLDRQRAAALRAVGADLPLFAA